MLSDYGLIDKDMTKIVPYLPVLILMTSCTLFETGDVIENDLVVLPQSNVIKEQTIACEEQCHTKSGLKKKICQKKCDIKRKRAEAKLGRKSELTEKSFWPEVLSIFNTIFCNEDGLC